MPPLLLPDLPETDHPVHGAGPSTVAIMLLFGSIIFAAVSLGTKTWLLGDSRGECCCIMQSFIIAHRYFEVSNLTLILLTPHTFSS